MSKGNMRNVSIVNFGVINKRGEGFFELYMVLIALAMCGTVIGLYFVQQENVSASLVSPLSVLEIRDDLDLFEISERGLILESLDEANGDFGDQDFLNEFEDLFFDGLDLDMKDFLLKNLYFNGKDFSEESFDEDSFFNAIYLFKYDGNDLRIVRSKTGKSFVLDSKNVVKFPVDVVFEFEREYLVKERGGKFFLSEK